MGATARRRVLVLGVYLADKDHWAEPIVEEFARSERWDVTQRWAALGAGPTSTRMASATAFSVGGPVPKFVLLNRLLVPVDVQSYEHVIVCDDDIRLPVGFLDDYLEIVESRGFSLAQPARTHDSYIDHPFVEQLDGLQARWTRFVEIGPLFSVDRRGAARLLPFDDASPMGWGYDLVWPCVMEAAGLRMGIVDATPVSHSLRKPVTHYVHGHEAERMRAFLRGRRALSRPEAFFIVQSYV